MCIRSAFSISCLYYSTCSAGIHMHHTPSETNTDLTIDSASPVMDPEFQSPGLEIVWRRRGSTHDGLTIGIN